MGEVKLREIAERGELPPVVELRAYWADFCDCDPYPDDERYPFAESEQFRSDRTLRGTETAQF